MQVNNTQQPNLNAQESGKIGPVNRKSSALNLAINAVTNQVVSRVSQNALSQTSPDQKRISNLQKKIESDIEEMQQKAKDTA